MEKQTEYSTIQVKKNIKDRFAQRCELNGYKISGVIERFMEDWLAGKVTLETVSGSIQNKKLLKG